MSPWVQGEWVDIGGEAVQDWCPECDPDANLTQAWVMRYCDLHLPDRAGKADLVVDATGPSYIAQGEAGGRDSKLICDLIHRGVLSA